MNHKALEKIFGTQMTRKVEHAKQFLKPDDVVLEISLDASVGDFSGFLNTLLDDKTKHSVLLSFKSKEECKRLRELADAKYDIFTDPAKLDLSYSAVFVTEENEPNLKALLEFVQTNTPRLIVWEWKNSNIYEQLHKSLHAHMKLNGYHPHVVGYENVYLNYAPEQVKSIPNPPTASISHYVYSILFLFALVFAIHSLSGYFFCNIAPTVKSLANRPM